MILHMELFVWVKASKERSYRMRRKREFLVEPLLKRAAEIDFAEDLIRSGLPLDFLDYHIEAFAAGLIGDSNHRYAFGDEPGADVRVIIRSTSTASQGRQSAMMKALLDEMSTKPRSEHCFSFPSV